MTKRTPYDNALLQALYDVASPEGDEEKMKRFATKVMGAHEQQSQGEQGHAHSWLSIFPKGHAKKYREVIENFDSAWLAQPEHQGRDKGGYVNYLGTGTEDPHAALQGFAEAANHRLQGAVKKRIREDERRKGFWEGLLNKK